MGAQRKAATAPAGDIGVVVIGRNEGARLHRCIDSVLAQCDLLVYVDSVSRDGSPEWARAQGVLTVELDTSLPLSAARARNAGYERLMQIAPGIRYVQFVDGDCVLADQWLARATRKLNEDDGAAIVCGRLHEVDPDASVFNLLCDIEWDGSTGEIGACGGNFMVRASLYRRVGGMNPAVIAAEDDELCYRIRLRGNRVHRLPVDMAFHDAAMTRLDQWWRRQVRCGHAYAQLVGLHGVRAFPGAARQLLMSWFWSAAVWIAILCAFGGAWGALVLLVFPFAFARLFLKFRGHGLDRRPATAYSIHCLLAKLPQLVGQILYLRNLWSQRPPQIIEHKGTP